VKRRKVTAPSRSFTVGKIAVFFPKDWSKAKMHDNSKLCRKNAGPRWREMSKTGKKTAPKKTKTKKRPEVNQFFFLRTATFHNDEPDSSSFLRSFS
jgi:hypothetical protein